MTILYSNVPPLRVPEGGIDIQTYFQKQVKKSDRIIIATGYASKNSLLELDRMIREYDVKDVTVILGMYYQEGCPESIYNTATKLFEEWKQDCIGEIRIIKSMKYHAKIYAFYKDGIAFSTIVGSNNLGAIAKEAGNLRQYELAFASEDLAECADVALHLEKVMGQHISLPLVDVDDINIIHEDNKKLVDVEGVSKVGMLDIESYKEARTNILFDIPLKVPGMPNESNDFMKSNINKCYAKGRENKKTGVVIERGWWETEIIVGTKITNLPNYPEKNVPFFVVTDDGWMFKAHVSGDHKKNFESDLDLKVLGYWLKGRLVASGLIEPVDSPAKDLENIKETGEDVYKNCKGVITYQKLQKYGRTSVTLTKTTRTYVDENGDDLDVWVLSFLPANVK